MPTFPNNLLTHSPADIVRQLLVDLGVGIANVVGSKEDWQVTAGSPQQEMPDEGDNRILVSKTSGRSAGRDLGSGVDQRYPGIQVMIRSEDHWIGHPKAETIRDAIQRVASRNVTLEGTLYVVYGFSEITDIIELGPERPNSERHLFTINALTAIRQLT